jgi:hypothetical protein
MSEKIKKIISVVLMVVPSAMIALSGIMKIMHSEKIVEGLSKDGFGPYISLFGIIEIVSVGLFLYPKTYKLGFLLLCCYLGGAFAVELAGSQSPIAAGFLVMLWTGIFLRDSKMFLIRKAV